MGWSIISGKTAKEMQASGDLGDENELPNMEDMQADDYIMFDTTQDREAAHRWNIAKSIRNSSGGAKSHIIKFLKENIGKPVTGEELRYVAKDATEWARRTRQLRTEDGWQIQTHWNGRPDLSPGVYVLETDRQLPAHDRIIDDSVRRSVLCRDKHTCQECGWSQDRWNQDNPRHLELHHVKQHIDGGSNEENNLLTLCNICHDRKHKKQTIK